MAGVRVVLAVVRAWWLGLSATWRRRLRVTVGVAAGLVAAWLLLPAWLLVLVVVAGAVGWLRWRLRHRLAWWRYVRGLYGSWPALAHEAGLTVTGESARMIARHSDEVGLIYPAPSRPVRFAHGFRVVFPLLVGQTAEQWREQTDRIAQTWNVPKVAVTAAGQGNVELTAYVHDPLTDASAALPPGVMHAANGLSVVVGAIEDGRAWVLDFLRVPHWLIVGATGSGKSTLLNALFVALAPHRIALVVIDLKGGLEFAPVDKRLTALSDDRPSALRLLRRLVGLVEQRESDLRKAGVRNVWKLPPADRPPLVLVIVDEVAELFLDSGTGREETEEVAASVTALIRLAQKGRALGVHLVVCGQRFGSDLGRGATALRAQLGGRIVHRVNDNDTARMVLHGFPDEAVQAALTIDLPGVAVIADTTGAGWARARGTEVGDEQVTAVAAEWADAAVTWEELFGSPPGEDVRRLAVA